MIRSPATLCSLTLLLLLGCSGDDRLPPPPGYRIEVKGTGTDHERFELIHPGARQIGFYFRDNAFLRIIEATDGLEGAMRNGLLLGVKSNDGNLVDQIEMRPFVCAMDDDWFRTEVRKGNAVVETHQVQLTPEGFLRRSSDLDRELLYSCESRSDAGGGDGFGSPRYGESLCDGPSRDLELTRDSDGLALSPTDCQMVYFDRNGGELSLGLTFEPPGQAAITAYVGHCFDPGQVIFPFRIEVGGSPPPVACSTRSVVETVADDTGPSGIMATGGFVEFNEFEFTTGGLVTGRVDVSYGEAGKRYRLHGEFSLPLLRLAR